jgi:hypothetical protein
MVLAQVVEDRGPIGVNGRRLYSVRLNFGQGEPTSLEVPETDMEAATEADKTAWLTKGTVALHQTITYFGDEEGQNGMPKPRYHYLIVAKPGLEVGSGAASIISLSQARESGMAQGAFHRILAQQGGPEAALTKAEEYLDAQHAGLKKIIGERRS